MKKNALPIPSILGILALASLTYYVYQAKYGMRAPYPPSPVIKEIIFDWSSHKRLAPGSDNWPVTWADDDHQYAPWGDGGGFEGTNAAGRVSLGLGRIEGGADSYKGYNVWGGKDPENVATFGGKSYGIISIQGIFYMWVSPDYDPDQKNYEEARLYRSMNRGATWTPGEWAVTKKQGLMLPTFLQFGKDYAGARDDYVYVYANHFKGGTQGLQKPGEIALMRVPKLKVMERSHYEFYAGTRDGGKPIWTANIERRKPVFVDLNGGVGSSASVSYNHAIKRYLLMTEHDVSLQGYLGVHDAPDPWGPWTTVLYTDAFGAPHIQKSTFFWNLSNKWLSPDGLNFVMIFTGVNENDSWNTVNGKFNLDAPSPTGR